MAADARAIREIRHGFQTGPESKGRGIDRQRTGKEKGLLRVKAGVAGHGHADSGDAGAEIADPIQVQLGRHDLAQGRNDDDGRKVGRRRREGGILKQGAGLVMR